jgi:hypothetical protein
VPVLTRPRFSQLVPVHEGTYKEFRYGTFFVAFTEEPVPSAHTVARRCVHLHRLATGAKASAGMLTVYRADTGLSHAAGVVTGAAALDANVTATEFDNDVFAVVNARADVKTGERRVQRTSGGAR